MHGKRTPISLRNTEHQKATITQSIQEDIWLVPVTEYIAELQMNKHFIILI